MYFHDSNGNSKNYISENKLTTNIITKILQKYQNWNGKHI